MGDSTKTGAWANLEEQVGEVRIEVAPTALGADALFISNPARYAGIVTAVEYYPRGAIAATDTNTRRLRVYNRGAAGAGTKQVAEKTYNVAGGALATKQKNNLTLSVTPADLVVAAGDVFEFASDKVGTGLADPGGTCIVVISRS
jgi:hypothetical protein